MSRPAAVARGRCLQQLRFVQRGIVRDHRQSTDCARWSGRPVVGASSRFHSSSSSIREDRRRGSNNYLCRWCCRCCWRKSRVVDEQRDGGLLSRSSYRKAFLEAGKQAGWCCCIFGGRRGGAWGRAAGWLHIRRRVEVVAHGLPVVLKTPEQRRVGGPLGLGFGAASVWALERDASIWGARGRPSPEMLVGGGAARTGRRRSGRWKG